MNELKENVERGAAWLDEHRPGWHLEIDVAQLDLSNPDRCVLGQIGAAITAEHGCTFENEENGFAAILWGSTLPCIERLSSAVGEHPFDWACEHGFNAPLGSPAKPNPFAVLDDLWIAAIKRRVDA